MFSRKELKEDRKSELLLLLHALDQKNAERERRAHRNRQAVIAVGMGSLTLLVLVLLLLRDRVPMLGTEGVAISTALFVLGTLVTLARTFTMTANSPSSDEREAIRLLSESKSRVESERMGRF